MLEHACGEVEGRPSSSTAPKSKEATLPAHDMPSASYGAVAEGWDSERPSMVEIAASPRPSTAWRRRAPAVVAHAPASFRLTRFDGEYAAVVVGNEDLVCPLCGLCDDYKHTDAEGRTVGWRNLILGEGCQRGAIPRAILRD